MVQTCKFFQGGTCKFGDSCDNLHESTPTNRARPSAAPLRSLCVFFKRGTCKQGEKCKFSHSIPTGNGIVTESDETTRTIPCSFWLEGRCIHGNDCRFLHLSPLKDPDILSTPNNFNGVTNSEHSSSLHEREGSGTGDANTWDDGIGIDDDQRIDPLGKLTLHLPGTSEDDNTRETAVVLDLESSSLKKDQNEIEILDKRPEAYPLPPSPITSSFELDADVAEITEISHLSGNLSTGSINTTYCIFCQKGTCNQGTACNSLHSNQDSPFETKNDDKTSGSCSMGECIYGDACPSLHSKSELASYINGTPQDSGFDLHTLPDDNRSTDQLDMHLGPGIPVPDVSLPTPPEIENRSHQQGNASPHQSPHILDPTDPEATLTNDDYPFDQNGNRMNMTGYSGTDIHTHSDTMASAYESLGRGIGGPDIDDDRSVMQNTEFPETLELEVVPHWSEYADPLVDPSISFCKFYAQARCSRGDLCPFRHSLSINEYALLFRDAQPALWSSNAQRVRAGYTKPISVSTFGICKFYPLGTCRNGDACTYLHVPPSGPLLSLEENGGDTYIPLQPEWEQQACWEYSKNGYCKRGDDCRYLHEKANTPTSTSDQQGPDEGSRLKTPLQSKSNLQACREYTRTGYCRRGDECRYSHQKQEYPQQENPGEEREDGGGWGVWGGDENKGRRLPCKYYVQGHCQRGDDCDYLHVEQDTDEGTNGWDNPPIDVDKWINSEVPERETAGSEGVQVESDELVATSSGWPVNDDATWNVSWTGSESEPCPFYLKGGCRKGKRCNLSHNDPESSWGDANVEPTPQDIRNDNSDHTDENLPTKTDPSKDQDGKNHSTVLERLDINTPEVKPHSPNDDEQTWSVPWVNDVNPSDEPRRFNDPCLAFGQGYCKWGDSCFYLHISPPDSTSQVHEPSLVETQSPPNDTSVETYSEQDLKTADDQNNKAPGSTTGRADADIKRSMFGCTVQFNTECFPVDILSSSESRRVALANLSPEVPYDEEFRSDIIALYGTLEDITLNESETAATAAIACDGCDKAAEAVVQLDGQTYDSMVVSARLDSVAETRLLSPLVSHSIKISWSTPSTFAWVFYPTITVAKSEEARLGGKLFEGRTLRTEFPKLRPKQAGPYPVKIANLPANINAEEVKALCCDCKLVQLGKPSYHTLPTSNIRTLLEESGPLDLLDVLPSDKTTTRITAFADFNTDTSLLSDLISLNGVKQPFIGGGALWIQAVYHVKYNIPQSHFQLVRDEITRIRDTYMDRCGIVVYDHEDPSTVHIWASLENAAAFGRANLVLQALLRGETAVSNGVNIWDEYFDLSSGATAVEKLNAKNPYCITLDKSTQTIRIIGSEKGRQQARSVISRLLAKVRDSRRVVPLDRSILAPLLGGGMRHLIDDLGANKVTLDVRTPAVTIRGEAVVHEKVQRYLESLVPQPEEHMTPYESKLNCVVCYRQPKMPIKLACKHVYCETCLQHVLRSSESTLFIPPRCIAMGEVSEEEPPDLDLQCTERIPYTVIRDVLSILDEVSFLRSSFLSYIRSRPEELFFCPTPNCETVYRSREGYTVYRCPSCSVRVCSACRCEYHEGLTCNERSDVYKELMNV